MRGSPSSLRLLLVGLALLGAAPAGAQPATPPAGQPAPGASTPAATTPAPAMTASPAPTSPPAGAPEPPRPATPPGTPRADSSATDTEVAEHVAQGRRLYLLGRYQEAIAEYRRAYELRADPQFLMDTAEAYRQLGATERALFYYERYLAAAPNAPDREIVEDRVTELELVKAPPPPPPPVGGAAPPAARPRPLWKRWWLWTAVGVALGAGITAAALSSRSASPAVPATDLGNGRFY